MKQGILVAIAAAGLTTHGFGQLIVLDNVNNTGSLTGTSNGQVCIDVGGTTSLFDGYDYNIGVTVYGGPNASRLTLMGTYTPANDAKGWTGAYFGSFTLGPWYGWPNFTPVDVPGVAPGAIATIKLQIWDYDDPNVTAIFLQSYAAAAAGNDYVGEVMFQQPTSDPNANPQVPAPDLVGMPSVILAQVPEPPAFGFVGPGLGLLFLLRPKSRWLSFHQNTQRKP